MHVNVPSLRHKTSTRGSKRLTSTSEGPVCPFACMIRQITSCSLRKQKQMQNSPFSPTRPAVSLLSLPLIISEPQCCRSHGRSAVSDICKSLISEIEGRLFAVMSIYPQQRYSGPSATSSSPQITTGLPGVFSPPYLQSSRALSASAPTFAESNSSAMTTSQNVYDKAVEVDQRKLRDTDLTPVAIRKWKTTYDIYANDPARRMTMIQAFGDVFLLCLGMMFPEDTFTMDDVGFNEYPRRQSS